MYGGCLFYPGKGIINPSKGLTNHRVYEHWHRRAAASWGAFFRQSCSVRTWDEKQARPFEESQTNTSSLPSSRLEEYTFVARPPHTTQFLCARDSFYCPSLSLSLFLVDGARSPIPDICVSWLGTLLPARALRPTKSKTLSMNSRERICRTFAASWTAVGRERPRTATMNPQ
jgi:hypothetical protein